MSTSWTGSTNLSLDEMQILLIGVSARPGSSSNKFVLPPHLHDLSWMDSGGSSTMSDVKKKKKNESSESEHGGNKRPQN